MQSKDERFEEIKQRWAAGKPGNLPYADIGYLLGKVASLQHQLNNQVVRHGAMSFCYGCRKAWKVEEEKCC